MSWRATPPMPERPATSSVQHSAAAYGQLLDLLDLQPLTALHRETVEHLLWFTEAARELSGYMWDDLTEHLRDRYQARVQPGDDLPGPQEGDVPPIEDVPELRNPPPRPIRDDPQA